MPESIALQAAALTDTGKARDHNEDSYGYCLEAGVFVVCDGMGGAAAGEVASRLAVDTLMERLCVLNPAENRRGTLEEAIAAANRMVYAHAGTHPSLNGMGTTLVAIAVQDRSALIGHVGDSRCYLLRAGRLTQRTHDHSLVNEQVRLGHMTQQEAEYSPLKNVITRAIGTQSEVEPEISELPLESGDTLLLCSDGLIREVPDAEIAAILGRAVSIEDQCRGLIGSANNAGSHDNVTVILIHVA